MAPVSCCMMDENGRVFKFKSKVTCLQIKLGFCVIRVSFICQILNALQRFYSEDTFAKTKAMSKDERCYGSRYDF